MELVFRKLPVDEQILFLFTCFSVLDYERDEALKGYVATGGYPPSTFDWQDRPEANKLWSRLRCVYVVLSFCREVPDYSLHDLIRHLKRMPVLRRRDYANGVDHVHFFRRDWPALFESEEVARSSQIGQWTDEDWNDFAQWRKYFRENIGQFLEEEAERELEEEREEQRRQRNRILVTRSNTDVIRVMEAMKTAGIIDDRTTGPQITNAFAWKGKLNVKPENYDAFKGQLSSPPSRDVVKMIGVLLEHAGSDVWGELGESRTGKQGRP
jgi:hypothetical protein